MGNASSSSDTSSDAVSDEGRMENKADEGISDDEGDMGERETSPSGDLDILFNPTSLRAVAAKMKDDIPDNVLQQHCSHILKWLEDREARTEETISLVQFCDVLSTRGVNKEDAVKAFQQFDVEGSGVAEVNTILDVLRSSGGGNLQGDLSYNIRMLQACSLIPGFVDVYASDQHAVRQHGDRILKFVLWNRAPSSLLPFPILNGFNNTSNMRISVLQNIMKNLKDTSTVEADNGNGGMGEVKLLTKCFSTLEVSTNGADACRLTNSDPSSCWQSDGAARSHWIRLHMKNNVVLKQLSVAVASNDQSYMPQLFTIGAGKNVHNLREIREVRVPSHMTGDVILVENLKTHYPIIQINIKRCHSDGCDTRIHSLKTLGYRVVKESGISVTEAAQVWYLQVLAATTMAAMPVAPQLRSLILAHTESALQHMSPLSLSPSSSDRPAMLNTYVLQEMDKFIRDLSQNPDGSIHPEGLQMLLTFNIARGHVAGILRALKLLLDNPTLKLESTHLLHKFQSVRDTFWEKHGSNLSLTLCGCDGGKADENSDPENVISGNWTAQAKVYFTEDGKTMVNMFFKAPDHIQVTKMKVKVAAGFMGARRGLVFVYKDGSEQFKMDDHIEKFKVYDTWGAMDFKFSTEVRAAGIGGKPDNPVAYFTLEDDWDEVEVPVNWYPVGQYVLVKFLEPRQENAQRIGILGIKFYGFTRSGDFVENEVRPALPNPKKVTSVSVEDMILHSLCFLGDLARDQASSKKSGSHRPENLDLGESPLDIIWELYSEFNKDQIKWAKSRLAVLQLLHSITPFITVKQQEPQVSAESLFQHLCSLVDSPVKEEETKLITVVRQLLIDGAAIFFHDKEARKKQLFKMMENVNISGDSPSVTLIFQSLCQFFSTVDPSGLLDLPKHPSQEFDEGPVLSVMETLTSVSFRELCLAVEGSRSGADVTDQHSHLVHLVCSLQTSLLAWCWKHLTCKEEETWRRVTSRLVTNYTMNIGQKAVEAFKLLATKDPEPLKDLLAKLLTSFPGSVFRQTVLLLTVIGCKCNSKSRVAILNNLQPVMVELIKLSNIVPEVFPKIDDTHWSQVNAEDVVLRTWELESVHNYENNQHNTQVFSCPGATSFMVDFDPRCETERRAVTFSSLQEINTTVKYDYLEFTDSRGMKRRFEMKVGTDKWPKQIVFTGGHRLHFLFHSDGSNNEWGYKFKVTAKGCPDSPLHWPFDLQLSLARLFGRLCGATLDARGFCLTNPFMEAIEERGSNDQELLKSELWTSLFRGGYMIGKLQRSLSGKFAAEDASTASEFLVEMIANRGTAAQLLAKCQAHCTQNPLTPGGPDVQSAVNSVFAALLWHTQHLREDITKYALSASADPDLPVGVSEGIYQAYNAAESIRLLLLAQRQAKKEAADKAGQSTDLADNVDPVNLSRGKALYLLKFAGLSKVQLKQEMKQKSSKQLKRKLSKILNTGVDNILKEKYEMAGSDKYPAFKLVLQFVRDPVWSSESVHRLLQERSQHAQSVADVYMFASEYVRQMSDKNIFQIPNVLFLQELLSFQNYFAKHYAEGLEGCGLDLESRVRRSYYVLIRRLVDSFRGIQRPQLQRNMANAYDFIQACLLHLLDIQYQPYDFSFVNEIKLPSLILTIAKETVAMRDQSVADLEDHQELSEYKQHKKWFDECSVDPDKGFCAWYNQYEDASPEQKKAIQKFIALYSDLLDVEINCDGCSVTLPGRRYRCLQCEDMDLCATCYAGGVKPSEENTNAAEHENHDMVYLMYKCNVCHAFIVGTRIHCQICEDFDLCLGCFINEDFPSGHTFEHSITKFPMVKLKNTKRECDTLLQSYVHQHVWLQFSALALSLVNFIYSADNVNDAGHLEMDKDYQQAAVLLHNQCVDIAMHCLLKVPEDAEAYSSEIKDQSDIQLEDRQEAAFSIHSQERIMGLLGAMVPPCDQTLDTDTTYNFNTETFLKLLFKIAKGDSGHEVNTQHLAMGLLGLLLTKSSGKVADEAVKAVTAGSVIPEQAIDGQITIEFLFSFGATCLERSGLDWACSLSGILRKLCTADDWKPVLMKQISSCVENLRKKPELSSIFALFVIAGFPEVLTIGTAVKYDLIGTNAKDGVVLKHFSDKHQTLLIDVKTRKRHTVKDKYVECAVSELDILDVEHLAVFMEISIEIISKLKKGEVLSVESSWVLSLTIKTLSKTMRVTADRRSPELYHSEFLQCIIHLASQGTAFSSLWLLKDLEVLCLMMYTQDRDSARNSKHSLNSTKMKAKKPKKDTSGNNEGNKKNEEWALASATNSAATVSGNENDSPNLGTGATNNSSREKEDSVKDDEEDDFVTRLGSSFDIDDSSDDSCEKETKERHMEGLDDSTKMYFQTLHEQLKVPLDVLRVLYDMNEGNTAALFLAIQENLQGENYEPTEDLKKLATKLEEKANAAASILSSVPDAAIDTGIHHFSFKTQDKITVTKATAEPSEEAQKLISTPDKEVQDEIMKQRKTRSAELLKKELEKQGKSGSRDFMAKVNVALAVLYSRQVLSCLLADWPEDQTITSDVLGCDDLQHIPCVLDLLNRSDSREQFQKVVTKVICHCDPQSMVVVARTACQFMEEVNYSVATRESPHNYKDNCTIKETLNFPGASVLSVTFDPKCATEEGCDELMFSTSSDYMQDKKIFSGNARTSWYNFDVPGDTLYFKFTSDGSGTDWGYKFTVSAGQRDGFDTGYLILNQILSSSTAIRTLDSTSELGELWSSLIYVACKQTGCQRLKAIQLLLRILHYQHTAVNDSGALSIKLALLNPLWQLYDGMTLSSRGSDNLLVVVPAARALTELFTQVENLTEDLQNVESYLVSMHDYNDIRKRVSQGMRRVAAVSVVIGCENLATRLLAKPAAEEKKAK